MAETDEQAHREARAHVLWFFRNALKIPGFHMMPAGYNTRDSMQKTLEGKVRAGAKGFGELTYEELVEGGYVIVGSPQTVIEKYEQLIEDFKIGMVMSAGGHLGTMPHWMVQKNMYLMAEEVIPHFRDPDGKPTWAQLEPNVPQTLSEYSARYGKPKLQPKVRLDSGEHIETVTAHVPELSGTWPAPTPTDA